MYFMSVKSFGSRADGYHQAGLDRRGQLVAEPGDGDLSRAVPVASWELYRLNQESNEYAPTEVYDVFTELFVTNTRVAFRCRRYNKGEEDSPLALDFLGILSGTIRLMADVWPRIVEMRDRKRHAMVGHLRYEWITAVGYLPEQGLKRSYLRLTFSDEQGQRYYYDFKLLRGIDARFIAHQILRNLGAYRLAMRDTKTPEEIAFYQDCASGTKGILPAIDKDHYAILRIPGGYRYPQGAEFQPTSY